MLTSIHISCHRYVCISTLAVHSHTCLCPRECSHLEPLCIHAYTHKYTYFILQMLLYMTPYTCIYKWYIYNKYTFFHSTDTFVYEPMLCGITYVCAVASAHTQNLLAYIDIYSQVYIYHITDTFVYERKAHIYLCPCYCSHLETLCLHAYVYKYA